MLTDSEKAFLEKAMGLEYNAHSVYKKKDKLPFTVVFDDNTEAAHRMTDEAQNGGNEAFANYKYDDVL